ncbi:MAG: TetR/AcrR family transcriptional regulator [Lachnospiraceae bacterium]|nr:TetR/AcrR family transcriptional regulator [Lachnospiraceae bacterium]
MPNKVFLELDTNKQESITDAAIKEFALYGYENSSTNRIVKECGISKGSLFKYFNNKEELYFYLIEKVSLRMAMETSSDVKNLPKDLFERVLEYSVTEISWYVENPTMGRFLIGVASEGNNQIGKKIRERFKDTNTDIYEQLLKDVDMSAFKSSGKEIREILRWVLSGFNESFLKGLTGKDIDIRKIKKEYIKQLRNHLKVLKNGF